MNATLTALPGAMARPTARRRPKTVLVVDDFPMICELVARHLSTFGFRVLMASDPAEVDRIVRSEAGDEIDLLLTDVEMPKLRGDLLAGWFSERCPRARVLFMTANPGSLSEVRAAAILPKPFSLVELNAAVRKALAPDAPEAAPLAAAA